MDWSCWKTNSQTWWRFYPQPISKRRVTKKSFETACRSQNFYGGKNNAEKENDPICDDNTVICDSALPVFTNHINISQDINADDLNCKNLISLKTRKLKQLVKMKYKKLRDSRKKVLRQEKTIKSLMGTLDKRNLLSKDLAEILGSNFWHVDMELFKTNLTAKVLILVPDIATILKNSNFSAFYSPRAYKFLRKALHLPSSASMFHIRHDLIRKDFW